MEKEAVSGMMLALLLIGVLTLAFNIQPVRSESTTEIYLDPSDNFFTTPATPVGAKFNVTIWIKDVIDVIAYQVHLTVDDDLLNITGAWQPTWDPDWFFARRATFEPPPVFDDSDLDGNMEAVTIGSVSLSCACSGSGKLAIIEFQIKMAPPVFGELSSPLAIDNSDTYPLDSYGQVIPTLKTNGSYKYTSSLSDVNGDNKIDIRDIATAALAFGSYIGHLKWNSQADINQDGKVDIKDLVLIAKNFGKTYP